MSGTLTRVAALYDIHGNLPALEAVLADVRAAGVELVVIGGDVMPGPMPRETVERLRSHELPLRALRGNSDREVLERRAGGDSSNVPERVRELVRWTADQLDDRSAEWLASWPATLRLTIGGGEVLFCHATPRNDTDVFVRTTPDAPLLPIFDPARVPLVVCGHTHMPFDRMVGRTRVVNAGSVGMPYGMRGASWLLLDPEPRLQHTRYDLAAAAARIRATPCPMAQDFADRNVLAPPSAEEFLAMIAPMELR